MIVKGMDRVFSCVSDMSKALPFYRDLIGLSIVGEDYLSGAEVEKVFKLKGAPKAHAILLKNDLQDTLVELIEFTPSFGKPARTGLGSLEEGIYDIAFFVKDIHACYHEALQKGYKFASEPIPYQPNWVTHKVWEVIMFGPDNTPIVLFQRETNEAASYSRQYIRLNHSAQIVDSIDKVIEFYGGVLGLNPKGDMQVPGGVVDSVMGYPTGTAARLAFYERKDTNSCLLEFIEAKFQTHPLAAEGRPPNFGIFMISFETDDLTGLMLKSNKAGFHTHIGPVVYSDLKHGMITCAVIEAPSRIMVQLFQRGNIDIKLQNTCS